MPSHISQTPPSRTNNPPSLGLAGIVKAAIVVITNPATVRILGLNVNFLATGARGLSRK
jgi:hypothetical protein